MTFFVPKSGVCFHTASTILRCSNWPTASPGAHLTVLLRRLSDAGSLRFGAHAFTGCFGAHGLEAAPLRWSRTHEGRGLWRL